jgi:diketogulonate reductase-like aldo/keto reductase
VLQAVTTLKTLRLPTGRAIPALGQGTVWMGDDPDKRRDEVAALRLGLDLGLALIDTAEMYADGGAEHVVGEAIKGRRDEVFLNSKVLPDNATRKGAIAACERSLRRLKTDYLDLYLLHWRESVPLEETLDAFQALKRAGKIRDYGVSNFEVSDMEEARRLPGGEDIVTNQVFYNLSHRGVEWDLLPWCRMRGLPVMAYSPLDEGKLARNRKLKPIAARHGVSPAQLALAWLLGQEGIVVFPKAGKEAHVRENRAALDLKLADEDLKDLDQAFRPPRRKVKLQSR